MSFKSKPTKEAEQRIKENKKKETTTVSNKKTIIVSVVATLAVVATVAAIFYAGTQYQVHLSEQIASAKAEAVAAALKPVTK